MLLSNRLEKGDRYVVSIEIIYRNSGRTYVDDQLTESGSAVSIDREKFAETILAVNGAGRREAVRRHYLSAVATQTEAGGKRVVTVRPVQGRTFTIRTVAGVAEVDTTRGLSASDVSDIETALRDDADGLVASGTHEVGDTWPVPQAFLRAFNYKGEGTGTCRLESIDERPGHETARIALQADLPSVTTTGEASRIRLSGHAVWSLRLKRVLSYHFGGPTSTVATSRTGATVTRTEASGTVAVSATVAWQAVGGKPVEGDK